MTAQYAIVGMAVTVLASLVCGGVPETQSPSQEPGLGVEAKPAGGPDGLAGSASCRDCHEKFYQLWSTSNHGLAMQPFTGKLAAEKLTPLEQAVAIGPNEYSVDLAPGQACVIEKRPDGEARYPILHAMGGKNVYYFLTLLDKGMLQTLPLAYDVRQKAWFDMAASGIRHIAGAGERPIDWRDRAYTFNTSCYGCHVSQLTTNYDPATDSYHTVWAEPGINCETCHGPASEHDRLFREAPPDKPPSDPKIISTKPFTVQQTNDLCVSCHAKAYVITPSFRPGDRYFDHYGLVALEDPDFYPDGRDLGENYTYTSWLMSPCVASGKLDCMYCHTSSGRYRFRGADANKACAPCHQDKVDKPEAHTRHEADNEGNLCISCHMPRTEFARMVRHDHSMVPPAPAATQAFGSPNACNICHSDKDAAWADKQVREWRSRDYQAPLLERAGWIAAARKGDWSRLPDMLAYLSRDDRNPIFVASLLRLLRGCPSSEKWPAIIAALDDDSPLVRSAAAEALDGFVTADSVKALMKACRDEYRLVRLLAAASLPALPAGRLEQDDQAAFQKAAAEWVASMKSRLDDYASHYNLGNYHAERGETELAIASYETSLKLNPSFVLSLVNASMAYSRQGRNSEAENALREALSIAPQSAAAHFNLGLLLAETGRPQEAEAELRKSLEADSSLAAAAYNLGVLLIQQENREGLDWCRRASTLQPDNPKYAYTFAFYQHQMGDSASAVQTLEQVVARKVAMPDLYALLAQIRAEQGDRDGAIAVYRQAAENDRFSPEVREAFAQRADALAAGE